MTLRWKTAAHLPLKSLGLVPDWPPGRSAWIEHLPFGMFMVEFLRPATGVELGVYNGHSFCCFCQAAQLAGYSARFYGVDTWAGDAHAGKVPEAVYERLKAHADARFGRSAELLRMTFDEALPRFPDGSLDLLHIDGLHTYEAVRHDFEAWRPKLSDSAVVLLHDTCVMRDDFGVHRFWKELAAEYDTFEFKHGFGLGVVAAGRSRDNRARALVSHLNNDAGRVAEIFAALGKCLQDIQDPTRRRSFRSGVNRLLWASYARFVLRGLP